jgi:hypothetical protein
MDLSWPKAVETRVAKDDTSVARSGLSPLLPEPVNEIAERLP